MTMHVTISQEVSFDKNGTNMLSNFMQGNIYPKVDESLPKFDTRIVASKLKSSSNNKLRSFFNIKYFTDSILGKTWHIILFYLVLYYMVQVLYQLRLIKRFCEDRIFHQKYNASQQCDQMIINMFIHWNSTEKLMLSCITFFLGFFVNHVVKRWWDQITRMPRIEPMILSLAGLVWPNKNPEGGAQEITSFRVAVLRYCHLSYAMAFRKISNIGNHLYGSEDFINKGLLTVNEYSILSRDGSEEIWWIDQWWVPLTWATNLVNKAFNKTQIVPKDHKDVISLIMKYQKDLETLITYSDNPMPTLYSQAVHLAVWSFLIFGMISGILQYVWKGQGIFEYFCCI